MVAAGLIVIALAAGLFYAATRQRARAVASLATSTTGCGELEPLAAAVTSELGGASFRRQVELAGRAEAGPGGALSGPLSGRAVVWWRVTVEREYETDEWRTDSQGRRERQTVRRTETVSEQQSSELFTLVDATGAVAVDPAGMPLDRPAETHDERRPPESEGSAPLAGGSRTRTIAFRHREWAIPTGTQLYLLGEARLGPAGPGQAARVVVGEPSAKGTRATISTRTEEEIVSASNKGARGLAITSVVVGALGLVLVVAGIVA